MKRIKRSGGGILNRALTLIALVAVLAAGVVIGQHLPKQSKDQVTVATVSAKLEDIAELSTEKYTYTGLYKVSQGLSLRRALPWSIRLILRRGSRLSR